MGPEQGKAETGVRTPPEVLPPSEKSPKTKKPLVQRLAGNLALRIALAGTALAGTGYGGYEAYQNIPGLHQTAEQSLEQKFPIKLDQSSFTPVTAEEEQELWQNTKTVDLEKHVLTMGFPFDQATIGKSSGIRISQEFDAILPPFIDGNKLKQEGVKNVTNITGLSQGDQYKLIYDADKYDASIITVSIAGVRQGEGLNSYVPAYTTLLVLYRDKATGESRGIWQSIAGLLAKPLVEFKAPPTDHGSVYEDGIPVTSGSPILELTTDKQDWDGDKEALLPGQKGQFEIRSGSEQKEPRSPIPLTGDFLLTSSGNVATQQ